MSSKSQQSGTTQRSNSFKGSYRLVVDRAEPAHECKVCGYVLQVDKDFESYFSKGACSSCVDIYYYPNADKWDLGWRPTCEEVRKNDV